MDNRIFFETIVKDSELISLPFTAASATYVFNNASNSANINVYVVGTNTYSTDPTSIIQYGYYTSPVVLKTGYRKYIKNSIYPTYKYAYLCMSTQDGRAHYISGKWSPDNCSGY